MRSRPRPVWNPSIAALLLVSVLQAGCTRTVAIPPEDLPAVAAARSSEGGETEVRLAGGRSTRVSRDFRKVHVRPAKGHVFLLPPTGPARAVAVEKDRRGDLRKQGWVTVTTTTFPIRADVEGGELVITPLPPDDPCVERPRSSACEAHRHDLASSKPRPPVAYPMGSVEEVSVEAADPGVGITVGVVLGLALVGAAVGLGATFGSIQY